MLENPFLKEYKTQEEDLDLIEKAKRGSKEALENLIKKHQPYIYNVAWKMVSLPSDAADITQEVIIKVITKLSQFKGESNFRTWLYRIVINHFLQMKRQTREQLITNGFQSFSERLDAIPESELTELEQQELEVETREMNLACMSGMLLCFTREQRLVYILGELFDADHGVGSELLGISKENFRIRLHRARKDLVSFMNNKCGLVNKKNPCRCYKKVTAMIENKAVDSKNLLWNRSEYVKFKQYISSAPDEFQSIIEQKVRDLHKRLTFRNDMDKKTFLGELLTDKKFAQLMNLN